MFRKLSVIAAFTVACWCAADVAQSQFGGLQLQVGRYGNGINFYNNYGNGFYNGYGNAYPYYGYGAPYYNVYNASNYNNGLPTTGLYPNFGSSYVAPYYIPVRPFPIRPFRYR